MLYLTAQSKRENYLQFAGEKEVCLGTRTKVGSNRVHGSNGKFLSERPVGEQAVEKALRIRL